MGSNLPEPDFRPAARDAELCTSGVSPARNRLKRLHDIPGSTALICIFCSQRGVAY
jgi:hypothetical protein